jgi:hypothetical protein
MSASVTASAMPCSAARSRARPHIRAEMSSAAASRPRPANSTACQAGPAASSSTDRGGRPDAAVAHAVSALTSAAKSR